VPEPAKVELTSDKLKERLDGASASGQKALLKEFGFDTVDAAKAALKELSDLKTASLTEKEKLEKQIADLTPKAQRADTLAELFTLQVTKDFSALPEAVQKAIDKTAEGDAEQRYVLMETFRESGLLSQAPVVPKPGGPASVTPAAAPPAVATPSKFTEWEAMRQRSPMLGDIFYQTHMREIERSRPAS
jgi:hypothetical protein